MSRIPIRRAGLVLLSLLLPLSPLHAEDKDLRELLRDALYTEEVTRDPEAAAKQYEQLLSQHDAQRAFAASALFRLAEVRRKQDRKDEAIALYQKLLTRFPEAAAEVKLARESLAALGGKPVQPEAPVVDSEDGFIEHLRERVASSPDLIKEEFLKAINAQRPKVVEFLLSKGADPATPNGLSAAADHGNLAICKLLLAKGKPTPEEGGRALQSAVDLDRAAILAYLLEQGLDPDSPVEVTNGVISPLIVAVNNGKAEAVKTLLDHGANIDFMVTSDGSPSTFLPGSPLHSAVQSNDMSMFRLLLERGAKPDLPTPTAGLTPLHLASYLKSPESTEMVKELLARGADPNRKTTLPPPDTRHLIRTAVEFALVTPFEIALQNEAGAAKVEAMLAKGASANVLNRDGQPLLFDALRDKDPERMKLLLKAGADPDLADKDGWTPLMLAAQTGDEAAARLLLEVGADPNKGKVRLTPLGLAIQNDSAWPIVELLLTKGAKPEAEAFAKAIGWSKWDLALRLLNAGAPLPEVGSSSPWNAPLPQALKSADALPLIRKMVEMGVKPEEAWIKSGFNETHYNSTQLRISPSLRTYLFRTFMLPRLDAAADIRFVCPENSVTLVSMLEEKSPSSRPKPLAHALLNRKEELRWSKAVAPTDRLTIWRKTADVWQAVHEFAVGSDTDFPALEWGDVVELSFGPEPANGRGGPPFPPGEISPELTWSLRKRVSFPVTVEIDGQAQEVTLRGDRFVFDPSAPREVPLGGARSVMQFLWQPEIAPTDPADSKAELVVRREGWPDVRLPLAASGKDFPLQAGDRISLRAPAETDEEKRGMRRLKVAVKARNAPFSRHFGRLASDPFSSSPVGSQTTPSLLQALAEASQVPWLRDAPSDPAALPPWLTSRGTVFTYLQRPDFSQLRIRRLIEDGTEKVIDIDLANIIAGTPDDATPEQVRQNDVILQPGDIVEVPVLPADAKVPWTGLNAKEASFFSKALGCRVQLTDSQGGISLKEIDYRAPRIIDTAAGLVPLPAPEGTPSLIAWSALLPPNSSSDASIIVRRGSLDEATIPADRLFLRDGDRVTLPRSPRPRVAPPVPAR